jgi:hypothetical protein
MKFKKGSIIPRRLGWVLAEDRKAQHCATFGSDCEIIGKRVYPTGDEPVGIMIKRYRRRMSNRSYKNVSVSVSSRYKICSSAEREMYGTNRGNSPVQISYQINYSIKSNK